MYILRMLYVPVESVTVIFAFGRSRIMVSFTPDVTAGPVPAVPGSRGVGSVCVPIGVNWPVPVVHVPHEGTAGGPAGAITGWPLFQFASVLQSPLESFHHTAGTRLSFRYSTSPRDTSTSIFVVPFLYPLSFAVLAYCQKLQGCATP